MAIVDDKNIMLVGLKGDKGDPGGTATVVQATGTSETDVMSQKAVTDELANKANIENDYVLIETITTTEDLDLWSRIQEPGGTPYNFKKILLTLKCPQQAADGYLYIRAYTDLLAQPSKKTYANPKSISSTSNNNTMFWAENENGMVSSRYGIFATEGSAGTMNTIYRATYSDTYNIRLIEIEKDNKLLPAGSIISIYAVRA